MENYDYNGQLALINLTIWFMLIIKYKSAFANIKSKKYLVKQTLQTRSEKTCINKKQLTYNQYNFFTIIRINKAIIADYIFPILLLILYGTFAYAEADTYHLKEGYEAMYGSNEIIQVEPFYFWLIQVLPNSYLFWRMVVWGTAAVFIFYTAIRMNLNANVFGLFIALNFLSQFAQTRGTLGFSLLMLALVLISQTHNKRNILLGLILIAATYFLHKSIPVFILFIPIALCLPTSKKAIIISLLLFPLFYKMVSIVSEYILGLTFISEITMEKGLSYMGRESTVDDYSVIGNLFLILQYSSIGCLFYILTNFYTEKQRNKTSILLFKYAFVSTYIAFLFWGQDMSDFIHTRSLHFSVFPTLFASVYCFQNKKITIFDRITMILLCLCAFKEIAYHIYKWW